MTRKWNKITVEITRTDGKYTRTIYVNGTAAATGAASSFPVFWGTGVNETYSKLLIDDLSITALITN